MAVEDDVRAAAAAFEAAPFDPARWSDGLDLFARICGGYAGQLIGVSPSRDIAINVVTGMAPEAVAEWERRGGAIPSMNPRAATLAMAPGTVASDADLVTEEQRRRSPFYREVFDPFDAPFMSLAVLSRPGDLRAVVGVIRNARQGAPEAHDQALVARLLPFADAALRMRVALDAHDVRATLRPFDALTRAAFVCDRRGRVIGASEAGEAMARGGDPVRVTLGRLGATVRQGDAALQAALARAAASGSGTGTRSSTLALLDAQGEARRVEVAPLATPTAGFPGQAAMIVLIGDPDPRTGAASLLRAAYGLTPAEARVAEHLARGLSARDIAEAHGVAWATVRAQASAVFHKMRVSKATQLAAIVGRLGG